MDNLTEIIKNIMGSEKVLRIIISNPRQKSCEYRKIDVSSKKEGYQIAKYTLKQVFHENITSEHLAQRLSELTEEYGYKQINLFTDKKEYSILVSKKGEVSVKGKEKALPCEDGACPKKNTDSHNRQKNYIISEGQQVEPLIDMGVFTREGKVVKSMYDKFRQINRFLEILDDEIDSEKTKSLNVIDFGCGKSYLTFVVYYYLTKIKGISCNIIGLDLKEEVIKKCNMSAKKYGYDNLHFELGDINGYKAPFDVDMVITLHACDTATDYALYNAIMWNARMIFSVPCCQHELNKKIRTDELSILTRYGIIKERFAALATDAIRGNLLEYEGYKTQLLEFIDFAHTPKNILIRAVKRPVTPKNSREKALKEVKQLMDEFNTDQTLYNLLVKDSNLN